MRNEKQINWFNKNQINKKNMKTICILFFVFFSNSIFGQSDQYNKWLIESKIPDWIFFKSHQKIIDKNKYEY